MKSSRRWNGIMGALGAVSILAVMGGIVGCTPKPDATTDAAPTNNTPAKIEDTKAKIQADPHIPAAQKAMIIKQLEQEASKNATKH